MSTPPSLTSAPGLDTPVKEGFHDDIAGSGADRAATNRSHRESRIGQSEWWQLGIIRLLIVGLGLAITGTVVVFTIEFGDDDNLGLALIHILVGPCALLGSMVWWILWFPEKV